MNTAINKSKLKKLPVLFLSHGGGPSFFVSMDDDPVFQAMNKNSDAAKWYRQLATQVKLTDAPLNAKNPSEWQKPKALLIISAHWETKDYVYVTNQKEHKELYYDYYGFPPETYKLKYPAKGYPELAEKVQILLKNANVKVKSDEKRNFDHGVFIPMLLMYPNADIPIVQLSINANFNPELHLKIGEALRPLREEGVLIIGSGHTTHNFVGTEKTAKIFTNSLVDILTNKPPQERWNSLLNWENIPCARDAHKREDHLIPLMVVIGATNDDDSGILLNDHMAGAFALHSFVFQ